MQTTPFLLLVQGRDCAASAERIWRNAESKLGARLACTVIAEHDIVLWTLHAGIAPSPHPRRYAPPVGQSLVFALPKPGPTAPALSGTDLLEAGSGLIAKSVPEGAAAFDREVLDGVDVLIEYRPAQNGWTLARGDPGLQTLYYQSGSDRVSDFAASTQLRALLACSDSRPALDHAAVSRYLCNGFFCEPETPIAGIRSLLPRAVLRRDARGGPWRPDADPRFVAASGVGGVPAGMDGRRAVRERLVKVIEAHTAHGSDIACLLSGGVDSSAVAAIAARVLGKTVHSYTLVFEDAALSEAGYASQVADRIGARHTEVLLKQTDFEGSLDWLLGSLDTPTTDAVNSLLIARAIGQAGHAQALVGVGSDEVFGGHDCMRRVPRALAALRLFRTLPAPARKGARTALDALTGGDPWLPSRGLRGKFVALLAEEPDPLSVYLLSRRVLLPAAVARLKPATPLASFESLPDAVLGRIPAALQREALSTQISYYEQIVYLRNQLLRDLQTVGIATGVDIRAPFVDRGLSSIVASLPAADVFGGARPKQFLIDCVSDVLPREAYERPKLGFVVPIGQWLGGLIDSRARQLSSQTELIEYLGLDPDALKMILHDCATARGRVFYTREWCLFVLLDWCSRHL